MLGLQAYYNDTNIIFNIQIPILSKEPYNLFHIISLPTKDSKAIPTKPYLIINPYYIQYFENKCPYIEGVYYCKENSHREATNDSYCIGNLLNNKPAHCELREKKVVAEIFQPEPNYVILINVPDTTIITTCGPNEQRINGSALIHFSQCEIKINDIIYSSTSYSYWDEVHIYPTTFNNINTTVNTDKIQLNQLESYQFAEKGFIDLLTPYAHYEDLYKSTGALGVVLIIIIVLLILKKRFYSNFTPSTILTNAAPANEPQRIFVWPSLSSREGGVTSLAP